MKSLLRIAYFAILYSLLTCTARLSAEPPTHPRLEPEIVIAL